jgi:hypothetical protein
MDLWPKLENWTKNLKATKTQDDSRTDIPLRAKRLARHKSHKEQGRQACSLHPEEHPQYKTMMASQKLNNDAPSSWRLLSPVSLHRM